MTLLTDDPSPAVVSVILQNVRVQLPGVKEDARAGNVPIVKEALVAPRTVGTVSPTQLVPDILGVKSIPPIIPVKNVCPFVNVSVVSTLLIAELDQFCISTVYCTGLPGAGLEGDTVFRTRSSSDTSKEADVVSDTIPGVVVPTVPWAMVFVKDIGTFGVCAVAVKFVVNVHVWPAAMVVLPVWVTPRSLTVRVNVPGVPPPVQDMLGMPVVFRPYARSPTPSIGLSVNELIVSGASPSFVKITSNVSL